jgi:hypothetical protein
MSRFLLTLFAITQAFTPWQASHIRRLLYANNAPGFAAVIDAVQVGTLAFTNTNLGKTFIDASRFDCCPNVFSSVITHEIGHLLGMDHNAIPGHPMNFSITLDARGRVIEISEAWKFSGNFTRARIFF